MAVAESQEIESDMIPKIATGFCSGLARTGGLCGALSGGVMGLNLLTGRREPGESVERNYARVRRLIDQFEAQFGATHCGALTGVDLGTEEGQLAFREKKQIVQCLDYVERATRMVLSLAADQE